MASTDKSWNTREVWRRRSSANGGSTVNAYLAKPPSLPSASAALTTPQRIVSLP
ncbi:hypothetical protein D3C71_2167750 [compost metagenome]